MQENSKHQERHRGIIEPPESTADVGVLSMKPFVVPFVLYLLGTNLASRFPDHYPLAYSAVCALVAGVTFVLLRYDGLPRPSVMEFDGRQRIVVPHGRVTAAVIVGLIGTGVWIVLSELRLEEAVAAYLPVWLRPEMRVAFDPFAELSQRWAAWSFVGVRLAGLVILVPIAEELFWRGFLLRWLISDDWQRVPIGTFSGRSFLAVTVLFTLAHPEWFAAAAYCLLLNGLLCWKKDLWICIVAHGVSNLALGIYILTTGSWWLW